VEIFPPCQSPRSQDQYVEEKNWRKLPSSNQGFASCSLGFRYFQVKDYLFQLQKYSAFNASILIHGDKTNKQECGIASFDCKDEGQSPLPQTPFIEYTYFLLNICHAIHLWVLEQDEADTESKDSPDFQTIFDVCQETTKSKKGGFFNVGNMRPKAIPFGRSQSLLNLRTGR
jgi:hypothetical protein